MIQSLLSASSSSLLLEAGEEAEWTDRVSEREAASAGGVEEVEAAGAGTDVRAELP